MAQGQTAPIHLGQGEVYSTSNPSQCVGTILGSCVATLIWDPVSHAGGVNHLLLPDGAQARETEIGFDVTLMERLINGVLSVGGERGRLRAKVFGGAQMIDGLGATGAGNRAFVAGFLADECIPCDAGSTGGPFARRLRVWPAQGRVHQLRLTDYAPGAAVDERNQGRQSKLGLSGVELL